MVDFFIINKVKHKLQSPINKNYDYWQLRKILILTIIIILTLLIILIILLITKLIMPLKY